MCSKKSSQLSRCFYNSINYIYIPGLCFCNSKTNRLFFKWHCNILWVIGYFLFGVTSFIIGTFFMVFGKEEINIFNFGIILIVLSISPLLCCFCGGCLSFSTAIRKTKFSFYLAVASTTLGIFCSLIYLIIIIVTGFALSNPIWIISSFGNIIISIFHVVLFTRSLIILIKACKAKHQVLPIDGQINNQHGGEGHFKHKIQNKHQA